MRKLLVPLLLLVMLLSGCSQLPITLDAAGRQARLSSQSLAKSPYNQFGFDLFRTLYSEENILISPVSIALALAMAQNGAAGDTAQEMAEALRVEGIALEDLNQSNAGLQAKLQDADVTLRIANSLWLSQGVKFRQQFIDDNYAFYDAQVSSVDFAKPAAADAINAWVKEKTSGLIEEIISNTDSMLACLVNAIYLHGEWQRPFDPEMTQAGVFHAPAGEVQAQFMQRPGLFDYLEEKDLQAIRLPYGEGRMAMYVFLPQDLDRLCRQLTAETWQELLKRFEQVQGELTLPKFKFGFEQKLKDELRALGMRKAFDSDEADFSRMTEDTLWVDQVLHKAVIEVDEVGTEAAAVAAVIACGGMPGTPFTMTVDRPFLFVIHDRETNAILFIGTVQDPS